ncbi:MAG: hypothetical protein PEPC_01744 [Peptostreptococcus russellii]
MRTIIEKKVYEIAESICDYIQNSSFKVSGGLYSGDYGILLFLYYLAQYTGDKKYEILSSEYADKLLKEIGNTVNDHTFGEGLSGILYLFDFLKSKDFVEVDLKDYEELLNNRMLKMMRHDFLDGNYDFMHGALGVPFYLFRKKGYENALMELIDYLYSSAIVDSMSNGIKWISKIETKGILCYNLSLSHGISSILAVLALSYGSIVSLHYKGKCLALIDQLVNYLLSQEIDYQVNKAFFPSVIDIKDKKTTTFCSRLAWCYGDLGLAASLYIAGKAINNLQYKQKANSILISRFNEKSISECGVFDAGFCHGSIGIASVARRMYLQTNNRTFLDTYNYWTKVSLDLATHNSLSAGYKTYMGKYWTDDYSLLTGISGIGLAYISFLSNDNQDWDELFLLS